jgi:hypothetical protein
MVGYDGPMKWKTANDLAGDDPSAQKSFGQALRDADLGWHRHNKRWKVVEESKEHEGMLRVFGVWRERRGSSVRPPESVFVFQPPLGYLTLLIRKQRTVLLHHDIELHAEVEPAGSTQVAKGVTRQFSIWLEEQVGCSNSTMLFNHLAEARGVQADLMLVIE